MIRPPEVCEGLNCDGLNCMLEGAKKKNRTGCSWEILKEQIPEDKAS